MRENASHTFTEISHPRSQLSPRPTSTAFELEGGGHSHYVPPPPPSHRERGTIFVLPHTLCIFRRVSAVWTFATAVCCRGEHVNRKRPNPQRSSCDRPILQRDKSCPKTNQGQQGTETVCPSATRARSHKLRTTVVVKLLALIHARTKKNDASRLSPNWSRRQQPFHSS